jgi:hypothetical protein
LGTDRCTTIVELNIVGQRRCHHAYLPFPKTTCLASNQLVSAVHKKTAEQ